MSLPPPTTLHHERTSMRQNSSGDASVPTGPAGPAVGEAGGETRRSFLHRSAAVTAAGAAALAAPGEADAQYGPQNILPTLYAGWNVRNFQTIRKHENDHVAFLVNLLGGNAYPDPGFQ